MPVSSLFFVLLDFVVLGLSLFVKVIKKSSSGIKVHDMFAFERS